MVVYINPKQCNKHEPQHKEITYIIKYDISRIIINKESSLSKKDSNEEKNYTVLK